MSIKIIGAGFPRTGTTTLKKALETLGYKDTYHFKDLIANPKKLKYWKELENSGDTNFEELFEGFKATVDFPGYPYYKILLEKYPDAKIILTKRDFEKWYESTLKTVWKAGPQTVLAKIALLSKMIFNSKLRDTFKCIKFMKNTYLIKQFDNNFTSKDKAKEVFFKHIEDVKKHVPENKLLVYDVAEGWQSLCDFLDLPLPKENFPHLNKKENFHEMVKGMIKEAAKS
ncbi:MAG: sulfotransferase family protein [Bacteroidetes bacterium]|nr:MAG: sulfotransferase family protein [Bacteroidota bacterium]